MKLTIYLLGIITLLSFKSFGQTNYDTELLKKEILNTRKAKVRALVSNNQDSMKLFYADNSKVQRGHLNMNPMDHNQFKDNIKKAKIKILSIKDENEVVSIVDENIGYITGNSTMVEIINGKKVVFKLRFEDIYYKKNGLWKCIFFHCENIK